MRIEKVGPELFEHEPDGRDAVLLVLIQTVPPTPKLVRILDLPTHHILPHRIYYYKAI
jgi:hypothetical protein